MTEVYNKGFVVILFSEVEKTFHGIAELQSSISGVCSVDVPAMNRNYTLYIFALEAETELPHTKSPAFDMRVSITGAQGCLSS